MSEGLFKRYRREYVKGRRAFKPKELRDFFSGFDIEFCGEKYRIRD